MNDLLVVVDMQNDFITGNLGSKAAESIVPKVVNRILSHHGTIFATQDTHYEDYLSRQEGHHLPVPHCLKNSDGWKIQTDVAKALTLKNATIIEKETFGSLFLVELLQKEATKKLITSITFVGLCTDICVISNVLLAKTALPEVPIYVDAAACAGVSPDSHEQALQAMTMCQAVIING